jgi:hypothetical protein
MVQFAVLPTEFSIFRLSCFGSPSAEIPRNRDPGWCIILPEPSAVVESELTFQTKIMINL